MSSNNACLDYKRRVCRLSDGNRKLTLHACLVVPKSSFETFSFSLISAMQFKRELSNDGMGFVMFLNNIELIENNDVNFNNFLNNFNDVFQDIPDGLPLDRGLSHTIPLEEGSKPTFCLIYRLSHAEKQETEKTNS
jgi:hypothetical protein